MATKKAPPEAFDETKLAELTEPIKVTVHKLINSRPMPLTLPIKPGEETAGTGWSLEEVRQLDEALVPLFGGGDYRLAATGENGAQMRWQSYFPFDRYPDRPLVGASVQQAQAGNGLAGNGPVTVSAPQPSYMTSPGWMQSMAQPQIQQPQQVFPQQAQQPQRFNVYEQYPVPRVDELRQEREAVIKLEAKMEQERLQASHSASLAAVNQELRRIQEQMQTKPSGEGPEMLALRAQLAEMQKDRESDKLAQMIREVQQSTQQQIAALTTMMQQQMTQQNQPNAMLMMLVETQKAQALAQTESARIQADAQKEVARLAADAAKENARTAIGPREMIDLVAKMTGGQDQITAGYTRLLESQAHVFENMLNAQSPPSHPALEMVSQGMQGIMGVAERYISAKESATTNQARAQAASAQAHAQAQVAIAAQRGLAAAQTVAEPVVEAPGEPDEEETEDPAVEAMEVELFGAARPAVIKLRDAIEAGEASPEQAAQAVLQGIDHFAKKGEEIKAFLLWQQNELGKLVGVLLPDALPSFREQMTVVLFEARKKLV